MAYMTDGMITRNFSLQEMANKNAKDAVKLVLTPEAIEHAQMMQELREWYGSALVVSSWYRTPAYNATVKGALKNSTHLDARATDIVNIPDERRQDLTVAWQVICNRHGKVGGVIHYNWGMHFDSYMDKLGYKMFAVIDKR